MATMVCFHAHPDDEAIATGGVMAKAASEGHRVVLVTATRGERGEVPDGYLRPGEALWERRVVELADAAGVLGVARQEFLGYEDSGMMGTAANDLPGCFWQADVDEAAARLAAILADEGADVLTVYDDHGNYGHPDHIQVHRVGVRAAELAGTPVVFEATVNRDEVARMMAAAAATAATSGASASPGANAQAADGEVGDMPEGPVGPDLADMGTPEALINTTVDVRAYLATKRQAMAAHGSQIAETSWFLSLPPPAFEAAFGREWFIRRQAPPGWAGTDLFDGL